MLQEEYSLLLCQPLLLDWVALVNVVTLSNKSWLCASGAQVAHSAEGSSHFLDGSVIANFLSSALSASLSSCPSASLWCSYDIMLGMSIMILSPTFLARKGSNSWYNHQQRKESKTSYMACESSTRSICRGSCSNSIVAVVQ